MKKYNFKNGQKYKVIKSDTPKIFKEGNIYEVCNIGGLDLLKTDKEMYFHENSFKKYNINLELELIYEEENNGNL